MGASDDSFQQELRKIFIADTRQQLLDAEQYLLVLEEHPDDYACIDRYFRFIHTIKGNAESLEFSTFGAFVHRFEDLLTALKKIKIPITSAYIDLFLEVNDFIKAAIAQYEADDKAQIANPTLSEKIERFIARPAASEAAPSSASSPAAGAAAAANVPQAVVPEAESIRVSAQKVHGIVNYFGEQVILLAALKHRIALGPSDNRLAKILMELEKVTYSLQSATLSLRMFPLKLLFDQMRRVVRETAKSVGKEVKFEIKGEAIELDKLVLDELGAPVMHMVRNAIDHGIEASSEDRRRHGKEPYGKVQLHGEQRSGFLHLKISDDGDGINKEKLLAKAIDKKIVSPEQTLTDSEIYSLIFHQGLSTKEVTSEISGRGVGMDVVLSTIKKLKGSCEIESTPHRGTTITIKVPLSLAMFEGTVFRLGNCYYIFPNADYYEIVMIDKKMIKQQSPNSYAALVNEKMLPLVPLRDYLQVHRSEIAATPLAPPVQRAEELAFVVHYRNSSYAVVVDEFVVQSKVVLKYLGREARDTFGISGATILGDGNVVLIVDIAQILQRYHAS